MRFQNVLDAIAYYTKFFNPEEIFIKVGSVIVTVVIVIIINRLAVAVVNYYYKLKERSKFVKTEWDIKQTRTTANMVRSFVSISILIVGFLTVLSYFVDIGALLAVAGVGTLAISALDVGRKIGEFIVAIVREDEEAARKIKESMN